MPISDKYTDENIKKYLKKWYGYGMMSPPRNASIDSRLINGGSDTSIVLYKRYSLLQFLEFPNHYYLSVDNQIWHPGDPSEIKIFTDDDPEDSHVMRAHEMCFHCTYHYFIKLFRRDLNFNILTNNCQNVIGYVFETSLIVLYHLSLVTFIVLGQIIFFVFSMACLILLILHQAMITAVRELTYSYCPHIRKAY